LINVEESFVGGEVASFHFDGVKYLDVVSPKNYQATITAFSAPEEFSACVGDKSVIPGFVLTRQPRSQFGFSYRTSYGNGVGYKIHIVYNATASSTGKAYSSMNASPSAQSLSWKVDAVPPASTTYQPSAHYVVDSTKVDASTLEAVETLLYGSAKLTSRLPPVEEFLDLTTIWSPLIIIPQDVTGLSDLIPGLGDLYRTRVDGINRALPNTRLTTSPTSGFYRME
jgi:hypothetical protein